MKETGMKSKRDSDITLSTSLSLALEDTNGEQIIAEGYLPFPPQLGGI
jgi:hypothetical protein